VIARPSTVKIAAATQANPSSGDGTASVITSVEPGFSGRRPRAPTASASGLRPLAPNEQRGLRVEAYCGWHLDAEIYRSEHGLSEILGAWVLGELDDNPHRYHNARARKNLRWHLPITRASGKKNRAGPLRPQ
jgi:hypothetical protein